MTSPVPIPNLVGWVRCEKHDRGWRYPGKCPVEGCDVTDWTLPGEPTPTAAPAPPKGKSWSNAKPTDCASGHRHDSKMEARVCERLTGELRGTTARLYQKPRLPLFSIAPGDNGQPGYLKVDFAVVDGGRLVRLIDAKSPTRRSRDWERGKRAVEAAWGVQVEEVEE